MKTAPKEVWRFGGDPGAYAFLAPVKVKGREVYLAQMRSGLRGGVGDVRGADDVDRDGRQRVRCRERGHRLAREVEDDGRLRVLNGGPRGVLTAKGPATFEGGVKIREETEVDVPDVHATLDLLQQLGFRVGWTYPKRRSYWMLDGVAITLDVLDFGWFVELEGPAEVLPEMARSLGLDPVNALRDSYSVMARKHQKARRPTKSPATSPSRYAPPPASACDTLKCAS